MRRAGFNAAGAPDPIFVIAIDVVDTIANASGASTYSDAQKAEIANAAARYWKSEAPNAPPDHTYLLPYVQSAFACFNTYLGHVPDSSSADGQGGCQVNDPAAACKEAGGGWSGSGCVAFNEATCKQVGGTWSGSACSFGAPTPSPPPPPPPTPADPAAECVKAGGTWDGAICSKPGVSTSGGLLTGALIVAVPVVLILLTMNMKKGSGR